MIFSPLSKAVFLAVTILSSMVLSMDSKGAAVSVEIDFGYAAKKPSFTYRLVCGSGNEVSFQLTKADQQVETGTFVYPSGFSGFVADLSLGFGEGTIKFVAESIDKSEHDDLLELNIIVLRDDVSTSSQFHGSRYGYTGFVQSSPRLIRTFTYMSINRPKMYRLWG